MQAPTLVILAAGIGSRFGGLKQITSVDEYNHAIIDFSLFDAYRAGFRNVVFIIKHEIESDFKNYVGRRMEKYFHVSYVYQQLDCLPSGFSVPENRVKPWGTGHAVSCCKGIIEGPFAVINADDFYGPAAFKALYDFLSTELSSNEHSMVAYKLKNTVTEHGTVARGICSVKDGLLKDIVERTSIEKAGNDALYSENGCSYPLSGETLVSMNCWGFSNSMIDELCSRFPAWLETNLKLNPEKCEYFLPSVVDSVIKENKGTVRVLDCDETWHGITYKEDLPNVVDAIASMRKENVYPSVLLD